MTLLDTQLTKKKHTLIGDIATDELECVLEEELLFFFFGKRGRVTSWLSSLKTSGDGLYDRSWLKLSC